jgi:peptidoglycan hydrolase CwlO-like protein
MEQKTEIPGLYKVSEGIIINKDNDALATYKKRKLREHKLDSMQEEMTSLKNDINEIKELLRSLIK